MNTFNLPKNFQLTTQFEFIIDKLPSFSSSVQKVILPEISIQAIKKETPLSALSFSGDHIKYSPLTIEFCLYENLENWLDVYNWMTGLGFPESFQQYKDLQEGKTLPEKNKKINNLYSDATLLINTAKHNSKIAIKYYNIHPVSLGSVELTTTSSSTEPIKCNTTFEYDRYTIEYV